MLLITEPSCQSLYQYLFLGSLYDTGNLGRGDEPECTGRVANVQLAGVGYRMLRGLHCSKGVYICTQRLLPALFLVHHGWSHLPQGPYASTVLHYKDRCVNSPSNTFPETLLSLSRMRRSGGTSPSCPW